MAKVTLNDLTSLENDASATFTINQNNTLIEQAFDDSLSRSGKTPNAMGATLDMNGNRILNLAKPVNPSEPLRLQELNNFTFDLDERVRLAQVARDEAETARDIATSQAGIATGQADRAEDEADAAAVSASEALSHRNLAEQHKNSAAQSVVDAAAQVTLAQAKADKANAWANTPANTTVPGEPAGTYSAKHWAALAQAVAGGISATGTTFTPYGNLGSTNVQTAIQELDDEKLAKTGGQITGNLTLAGTYVIRGGNATDRAMFFTTDSSNRWSVVANAENEAGSNAGTNFYILRYSDAGAYLGAPLTISRASGRITLEQVPIHPTPATATNDTQSATTAFVQNVVSGYHTATAVPTFMPKSGGTFTGGVNGSSFTASGRVQGSDFLATGNSIYLGSGNYSYNWNGSNYTNHRGVIWDQGNFNPDTKANATNPYMSGAATIAGTLNVTGSTNFSGAEINVSVDNGVLYAKHNGGIAFVAQRNANTGQIVSFRYSTSDTQVGIISTNGSSVTYGTTSDIRAKENIMPSFPVGEIIDDIEVVDYTWKNTGEYDKGVIAQQVMDVYPLAVVEPDVEGDFYSVDYSRFVPLLLKEIQDLRKRVAELEKKNEGK